jgi:glutaminyl-peptide cyclotransferase
MSKSRSRPNLAYILLAVMLLSVVAVSIPRFLPKNNQDRTTTVPDTPKVQVNVPPFNADSAYQYVKKQVDFGPRVPGTPAHKKCAAWLAAEFKRMGLTVIEQKFKAQTYFGPVDAVNIIAQHKPELPTRILLCAHWDSRHVADKDDERKDQPILGADDGGSGVGVLLELARVLKTTPPEIGVDLILFDAEDLGDDRDKEPPAGIMAQQQDRTYLTWCLGSQHWSKNLHKPGYSAQFGILLDMVGAKGAVFPMEGHSRQNAPGILGKIWNVARELGYGDVFIQKETGFITDDHYFVMSGTRIPTVDIISLPNGENTNFGTYHHTHEDNMSIIDPAMLGKVGHVVTTVVYRHAARAF